MTAADPQLEDNAELDPASKWFVDLGPDVESSTGAQTSSRVSFDNHVDFLIDGRAYVSRWLREVRSLIGSTAERRRLLHTAWRLDNIGPHGRYSPTSDLVINALAAAADSGVEVIVRLSGHALGLSNMRAHRLLRRHKINAYIDRHLRSFSASQHEKFTVFVDGHRRTAMTGSVDLSKTRWDTPAHNIVSTGRYTYLRSPSHDTGVAVTGSAAHELEVVFDDFVSDAVATGVALHAGALAVPPPPAQAQGSAVQVLRTVPVALLAVGATRESSIFSAYCKALEQAQRYVYIEDQYFWPHYPARPNGLSHDLLDRLLHALTNGADLFIVVPAPRVNQPIGALQAAERHRAMSVLTRAQKPGTGRVTFLTPVRNRRPVYVHSKLLIVDDELALVGSANVNARSMFHDGELAMAIADTHAVQDLRARLWEEHLGLPAARLCDYDTAAGHLSTAVDARRGYLRRYRQPVAVRSLGSFERLVWTKVVDPLGKVL